MEDLSIQGKLSSNSFDVVMVYMLYVKDHPDFISQAGRLKNQNKLKHTAALSHKIQILILNLR